MIAEDEQRAVPIVDDIVYRTVSASLLTRGGAAQRSVGRRFYPQTHLLFSFLVLFFSFTWLTWDVDE
jgi:hypothetical protein